MAALREEAVRHERVLGSTVDKVCLWYFAFERLLNISKTTLAGLEAIRGLIERGEIPGIHGVLYELFEVDDRFRRAVEVAAGNKFVVGTLAAP